MTDNAAHIARLRQRLAEIEAEEKALREEDDDVERRIQVEEEKDENETFEFLQKKQAFHFAKFRTQGRYITFDEILKGKFKKIKLPKRGRYRGPGLLAGRWKGSRFNWDPDEIGHHGSSKMAKRTRINLQRRLRGHQLHLERTLGWGGNGIASLYRFKRHPAGPAEYVVVKCNINSEASSRGLKREREVQRVGA